MKPSNRVHLFPNAAQALLIRYTGTVPPKLTFKKYLENGIFHEFPPIYRLLGKRERRKLLAVLAAQISMSLLDLVGVIFIGFLGSLVITGVTKTHAGNRTYQLLKVLGVQNLTIQEQVGIIGLIATLLLVFKTILSLFFKRRIFLFLSRRSARLSGQILDKILDSKIENVQQLSVQNLVWSVTTGVDYLTVGVIGSTIAFLAD